MRISFSLLRILSLLTQLFHPKEMFSNKKSLDHTKLYCGYIISNIKYGYKAIRRFQISKKVKIEHSTAMPFNFFLITLLCPISQNMKTFTWIEKTFISLFLN